MSELILLLHGSANGSYSWRPIEKALVATGASVFAPDMLGYGAAPAPSAHWTLAEEVAHLQDVVEAELARRGASTLHLVAHSLGSMFGLHLRRALGARVTRMTLIDPVVVSVLREPGEEAAYAEMEAIYWRFQRELVDEAAARIFVEHWNGPGAWDAIGERGRAVITALTPKLRLETNATRSDTTALALLAASPPATTILLGEKTRLAPRAVARQLARALDATTVVVAGAGHMIPLTHPAAVVAALVGNKAAA